MFYVLTLWRTLWQVRYINGLARYVKSNRSLHFLWKSSQNTPTENIPNIDCLFCSYFHSTWLVRIIDPLPSFSQCVLWFLPYINCLAKCQLLSSAIISRYQAETSFHYLQLCSLQPPYSGNILFVGLCSQFTCLPSMIFLHHHLLLLKGSPNLRIHSVLAWIKSKGLEGL